MRHKGLDRRSSNSIAGYVLGSRLGRLRTVGYSSLRWSDSLTPTPSRVRVVSKKNIYGVQGRDSIACFASLTGYVLGSRLGSLRTTRYSKVYQTFSCNARALSGSSPRTISKTKKRWDIPISFFVGAP